MIKNMNYLINFFLYSLLSKLFRQELVAMVSGTKRNRHDYGATSNDMVSHGSPLRCFRIASVSRKNRRGDDVSSSGASIAELSFSVEAFKGLKNRAYLNSSSSASRAQRPKLFFFKLEPANILVYFRHARKTTTSKCDQKLLKLEKQLLNLDRQPLSNGDVKNLEEVDKILVEEVDKKLKPIVLLKKSNTHDAISSAEKNSPFKADSFKSANEV